jgi:DNA polymerase I-like protein with 3'-5' exonuclease and polymerase domains
MIVTIDFETEGIKARPQYPPIPVGVGIKVDDQPGEYFGWGHPTGNNSTFEAARAALAAVWASGAGILCHNAKFDLDVAQKHMDLPLPPWERLHDTQFLLYLANPHAKSYALKPSAERLLGWAPEEQDEVRTWVLANVPGTTQARGGKNFWAGHICLAPGDLVGRYCVGDVDRTYALYQHLMPMIENSGMGRAYDRERRLLPTLLRAERRGIRFDLERASRDEVLFGNAFEQADRRIRERLGLTESVNLNSGDELADALLKAGAVKELPLTPTGRVSTAKGALEGHIEDPELFKLLRYRGVLKTCLGTHLSPTLRMAEDCGGRVHTNWHQTRGDYGRGGTVTGRMSSSSPNVTNLPNDFSGCDVDGLPHPPIIRQYFLPEPGHLWLKRDYCAQEMRVLAHFENGTLMEAFQAAPDLDPHAYAGDLIQRQTGTRLERKPVKTTAFSILYGSGVKHLSEALSVPYDSAQRVRELYLGTFPDVKGLMRDVTLRGESNQPVRTVGGRLIYVEPPDKGRSFAYKMLNHLIQGSAADITKQGVLNAVEVLNEGQEFIATVHDEISFSVPGELLEKSAKLLREAMADFRIDVPLTSDCYVGHTWAEADESKRAEWH